MRTEIAVAADDGPAVSEIATPYGRRLIGTPDELSGEEETEAGQKTGRKIARTGGSQSIKPVSAAPSATQKRPQLTVVTANFGPDPV